MTQVVSLEIDAGIAVLEVCNPPVNALSAEVRQALQSRLRQALADPQVGVVLIVGAGRTFPAGADISEFDLPIANPTLPDLCNEIEASPKPVIAALHGTALGGGFEIALAAHYRIAHEDAKFGLPEVNLGILPGAGGTQRTPRLIGAEGALDMMLSGRLYDVQSSQAQRLFDAIVEGDLKAGARVFAHELLTENAPVRPTRAVTDGFADPSGYQNAIISRRNILKSKDEKAPLEIIRCVEAAALLPFDVGLEFERSAFETCLSSNQSEALRHAFFAERKSAKFLEVKNSNQRDIGKVGIVGGGTMGSSIAVAFLDAGLKVVLVERDRTSLQVAIARIEKVYERAIRRKRLSETQCRDRLAKLHGGVDYVSLGDADLVVETVSEDMELKKQVLYQVDSVIREGAILASNTSYLNLDELASATASAEDVIGLHFFAPAHVMRLIEVVVGAKTSPDVVATCVNLAKRLGKIPVRTKVSEGYIGNRILMAYRMACDVMVEDGASPYQVDQAMRLYGMAMGPYEAWDLAGLDISWAQRQRLGPTRDPAVRYVAIADRLCESGRLGQKSGRGYYLYKEGSRVGMPDPDVLEIIDQERQRNGIMLRAFSDKDIQRRAHLAMVNEGARLLREGVASRPSDIDTIMLHGFGFPRWRGGPMKSADLRGLLKVKRDLQRLEREDATFWAVEPIFETLIKNGQTFDALNA